MKFVDSNASSSFPVTLILDFKSPFFNAIILFSILLIGAKNRLITIKNINMKIEIIKTEGKKGNASLYNIKSVINRYFLLLLIMKTLGKCFSGSSYSPKDKYLFP